MEKPMHIISRDLLVTIRQYLGRMPHDEVNLMVAELEKCPTVNMNPKPEPADDKGAV